MIKKFTDEELDAPVREEFRVGINESYRKEFNSDIGYIPEWSDSPPSHRHPR